MIQVVIASLILVVLNIFMLFILRTVALRLSLKIKQDANRLFSNYDLVLERKKENMIKEYEESIRSIEIKEKEYLETSDETESYKYSEGTLQEYRDEYLFDKYEQIKALKLIDRRTLESVELDNLENIESIKEFRDLFSSDLLYKMTNFSCEEQLDIVRELINSKKEFKGIKEYVKESKFNIVEFVAYLDYLILRNPNNVTIYKAKGSAGNYEELDTIVEGYIVSDGKRIYDYALKRGDVVSG